MTVSTTIKDEDLARILARIRINTRISSPQLCPITKIQETVPAENIRLGNLDLEAQIAKCIEQLPPDYIVSDDEEEVQPEEPNEERRARNAQYERKGERSWRKPTANWQRPQGVTLIYSRNQPFRNQHHYLHLNFHHHQHRYEITTWKT
ncbi:uncharacterized protein LOC111350566 [Spodoptera litura]|uniref:Uncharacterized protein LOC111350566 n=1 Tax=Spodoptera litura TaxID=69820 RepID=A0A9J7IJW5_SPOLT|nr:uncharacterized protein LOC111350566 [Spodoptera litura]